MFLVQWRVTPNPQAVWAFILSQSIAAQIHDVTWCPSRFIHTITMLWKRVEASVMGASHWSLRRLPVVKSAWPGFVFCHLVNHTQPNISTLSLMSWSEAPIFHHVCVYYGLRNQRVSEADAKFPQISLSAMVQYVFDSMSYSEEAVLIPVLCFAESLGRGYPQTCFSLSRVTRKRLSSIPSFTWRGHPKKAALIPFLT